MQRATAPISARRGKSFRRCKRLSESKANQRPEPASENFEDLFEHAPCGYLTLSPDGRIARVNQTFCTWTGYSPGYFIGKRVHQFLNMAGRIYYETHIAPLLRMQGFFNEFALDFVTESGGRMPMIANAAEQRSPDGETKYGRKKRSAISSRPVIYKPIKTSCSLRQPLC
jgi:sigma-B regulation protein RsbU (phosphoserine phosphatase)